MIYAMLPAFCAYFILFLLHYNVKWSFCLYLPRVEDRKVYPKEGMHMLNSAYLVSTHVMCQLPHACLQLEHLMFLVI